MTSTATYTIKFAKHSLNKDQLTDHAAEVLATTYHDRFVATEAAKWLREWSGRAVALVSTEILD